ncbi:hypothetical protein EH31_02335 [Erythrobacter longus]|uniref:Lipoprotein n=1 Tax=Erythrobacter longus TaxID=1044 RepID=A0A074MI33_ERYLO|nr:hypothetical protein [Erythrobacter longus]KEO91528.1 hypothetical protein EH31_02335 [Erythrobacter longus]
MKIKFGIASAIGALSLAGCATFSNMETGLNTLMGQPLQAAIDTLGYPQGQMHVGEDTVYGWGREFTVNMPQYQTSNTYGQVGGTSFSANTGTTTYVPTNYNCNVRIAVGPDNRIKNWEFDGNIGGCEAYSSRLKRLAE